jgi:hypothetical protein
MGQRQREVKHDLSPIKFLAIFNIVRSSDDPVTAQAALPTKEWVDLVTLRGGTSVLVVSIHRPPLNPLFSWNDHLFMACGTEASAGLLDVPSQLKQFPDIGRQIIQEPLRQFYEILLVAAVEKSNLYQRS